jgi:hypothetical protein
VFDQVTELITRRAITVVALYNGRFLHDRAVAAAAQQLGIPLLNYDLGGNQTNSDLTIDDTQNWDAYFGGQENALRLLSKICSEDPDIFLVVRSHPHKRHKPANDVREWLAAVTAMSFNPLNAHDFEPVH